MTTHKILVVLAALCCFVTIASADVPPFINFQGTLTDSTGNPITGTRSIDFAIYES